MMNLKMRREGKERGENRMMGGKGREGMETLSKVGGFIYIETLIQTPQPI